MATFDSTSTAKTPHGERRRFVDAVGHLRQAIRRVRRRWLAAGGIALIAMVLLGCAASRYVAARRVVPQISDAVGETNTWHFTGWRTVENKRVPWEIWGRREPFFYREQIGSRLLIATDRQRLQLVPPGDHRAQGLALIVPGAVRERSNGLSGSDEAFAEGMGSDFLRQLTLAGRTSNAITLRSRVRRVDSLHPVDEWQGLSVDARTLLPTHYELHRAAHSTQAAPLKRPENVADSKSVAELTAEYNVALPAHIDTVVTPQGYAEIDLMKTALDDPATPKSGTASANGITIHAEAIEADRDGDLHLRFTGWLGRQKYPLPGQAVDLSVDPVAELAVQPQAKFTHGAPQAYIEGIIDERDVAYISLPAPVENDDASEWYLIPMEPVATNAPRPKELIAYANAGASWYEYLPEADTDDAHALGQAIVKLNVPLPRNATSFDYDTRRATAKTSGDGIRRLPLNVAADRARVRYYLDVTFRTNSEGMPLRRGSLARALYWNQHLQAAVDRQPTLKPALQSEIDANTQRLQDIMTHRH